MADRYYNRDYDRTRLDRPYDNTNDYWDQDYGNYNRDFTDYGYNRGYGMNRYRSSYDYDRGYGYGRYPYSNGGFNQGQYYGNQPLDWTEDYFVDYLPDVSYTEFWLIPGPFTGLGPQGYTRTDENIKDDVNDRLTQHGGIDARNIHVDVKNGEVTLTGTVASRKQKRMAEDVVDSVPGVEDIHNNLKVQKQQQGQQGQQGQPGHLQGNGMKNAIKDGMEVVGKNGKTIGKVKQVRQNDFLLDRPAAKDLFVPFNAAHLQQNKVQLDVTADQVEQEGWQTA